MDFATYLKRLGKNVRRARWRRGLTQQQLAGESFSTRYVADVERGARNVSMRTVFELAALLGVRVIDLVNVGESGRPIDLSKVPECFTIVGLDGKQVLDSEGKPLCGKPFDTPVTEPEAEVKSHSVPSGATVPGKRPPGVPPSSGTPSVR